jgi:hypothetical protein
LQFSPLSLSRERERERNTTIEPVTNKTTKPRHSRQQRNDPASRSRKKKRTRKAKTPADSSDHAANATIQAHAASNSTRGGRPAKTKVKAKEGRKTG